MLRVLVGWYFPAPCKWLVRIGIGRMYQYRGGVCFGYELLGLGYNYYKIGWAGLILTSYEFVDASVNHFFGFYSGCEQVNYVLGVLSLNLY